MGTVAPPSPYVAASRRWAPADRQRARRLASCREAILPIWERRADGNAALRRSLDCPGTDPDSHEERLQVLIAATWELRRHGEGGLGVEAALMAAGACLKAYVGVPEHRWRQAVERVLAAERDARGGHEGDAAPG